MVALLVPENCLHRCDSSLPDRFEPIRTVGDGAGRAFVSSDGPQYVAQILHCRFCLNSEPLGFSLRLDGESRLGWDRIIAEHYFRFPCQQEKKQNKHGDAENNCDNEPGTESGNAPP